LPPRSSTSIALAAASWICSENPRFACASAERSCDCTSDCTSALPLNSSSSSACASPDSSREATSRGITTAASTCADLTFSIACARERTLTGWTWLNRCCA